MAVVTIGHHPELTAEAAISVFQKGFAGEYEVYKWNRLGRGQSLRGREEQPHRGCSQAEAGQGEDRLHLCLHHTLGADDIPGCRTVVRALFARSSYQAMVNEVKTFIENAPEFK